MAFHPYLMFSGNCRQALTRYQEIFGGELSIMAMSDMPPGAGEVPAEQADLVMHATLIVGDSLLMGSDDPTGGSTGIQGMSVSHSTPDADQARRVFDLLAEGGQVTMPMDATFWSPAFGMCVDRFGVPWMIDAEHADNQPENQP